MRPTATQAIVGGVAGTIAITPVMLVLAPLLLDAPSDIVSVLGNYLGIGWRAGLLVHFLNGSIIYPLAYAFLLYRVLPGSQITKGAIYGAILWFTAHALFMPVARSAAFFSATGLIATLLAHILYGAVLGSIAGECRVLRKT